MPINIPPEIKKMLANGAPIAISYSGGKDSDCMATEFARLRDSGALTNRMFLIHADLKRMEWNMTEDYVKRRAAELDMEQVIVTRTQGDLLQQIQERAVKRPDAPPFPSSKARYCTSDNKRAPIDKYLRTFTGDVVCAIGLRAEESSARAKRPPCELRTSMAIKGDFRHVLNWHPIHHYTIEDVWATLGYTVDEIGQLIRCARTIIKQGGLWRDAVTETSWKYHPAYLLGNERLSCALCVLASANDLRNGARFNAVLAQKLIAVEQQSGFSFRKRLSLSDLVYNDVR